MTQLTHEQPWLKRAPVRWAKDIAIAAVAALVVIGLARAFLFRSDSSAPPPVNWQKELTASIQALPPSAEEGEFLFDDPVPGHDIVSPFGLRQLPWEAQARLHAGVDIAAPAGTLARLVADGVVLRAGHDGGYGNYVEVQHPTGLASFYAHLSGIAPYVRAGTPLRRGAPIGTVGSTGSSTGAHLHFEISREGIPLNPAYFIRRRYPDAAAMPIDEAARIPPGVRRATVSTIPAAKRELMAAQAEASMGPRIRFKIIPAPGAPEGAPAPIAAPADGATPGAPAAAPVQAAPAQAAPGAQSSPAAPD